MSGRKPPGKSETKDSEMKGQSKGRAEERERELQAATADEKSKSGGVSSVDKNSCPVCTKGVLKSDLALECEICEAWFHISCQDISEEEHDFLAEHSRTVHWYCETCNRNVAKVITLVANLKQKHELLEAKVDKLQNDMTGMATRIDKVSNTVSAIDTKMRDIMNGNLSTGMMRSIEGIVSQAKSELEDEVKSLREKVTSLDTKVETAIEAQLVDVSKSAELIKKELEPSWASVVSQEVDNKLGKVSVDVTKVQQTLADVKVKADEERDRENRSHNIIIYRVPESGTREDRVKTDKAYCLKLTKEVLSIDIQETDIKSVFRLGKRENAADRPLLVQFRDKGMKNNVMESLYRLKGAEDAFRNISVTRDLTQAERAECKRLVDEAKKRQQEEQGEFLWRVRGLPGQLKLIKIKKTAQQSVSV